MKCFEVNADISDLQTEIGPANIRRMHKDEQLALLTVMFSGSIIMILNLGTRVESHGKFKNLS